MDKSKNFVIYLAGFVAVAFVFTVLILIFHTVPKDNKDMVNIFLGIEGSSLTGIIGYYFGSSDSSAKKNEIIATSAPIPPPTIVFPAWTAQNYMTGAQVSFSGRNYQCIVDTTNNQSPTDTAYWKSL